MKIDFEAVFKTYSRQIYNLAYRLSLNHFDAQDILQKTFMNVYEKMDTFMGKSSVKTWIYQIAINASRNYLRDKREHLELKDNRMYSSSQPNQLSKSIAKEEAQQIFLSLNYLPEKQKEVLVLRIYDDHSFNEIGEILGMSENSAKVNYHFALKKLKEIFKNHCEVIK